MPEDNEDIVIEDDSDSVSSAAREKKLRERLKECEAKAKEYLDGWQRAQADFVNIRKRDEEAKVEFLKFAKSDVLAELIPILDSFSLAVAHGHKDVLPIQKQMLAVLKQHGLEEVDPLHKPFDPKYHEAIGVVPTENPEEDNEILEVLQKGYILSGKTLRPAKVRTGEYKINRY